MGCVGVAYDKLPLGFRFKPTDVELIDHYLRLKINGRDDEVACITEVDICRVEPCDLPDLSGIKTKDKEWFFFCPQDRKYPSGQRRNRATKAGYWKTTGKDRTIKSSKLGLIGMKKTLVFYSGRAPKGTRTSWVIHEYCTTLHELNGTHPGQAAFVLCRLFNKADDHKNDDNDECDEAEAATLSPSANSPDDVSFGPLVMQASSSLQPDFEQLNRLSKTCDSFTSETVLQDHSSHTNSFSHPPVQSNANEEATPEVNSHLSEKVKRVYDPFSADLLLDQMYTGPLWTTDIGDEESGLLLPHDPIADFIDSAIKTPDDYLCDETVSQGNQFVGYDTCVNASTKDGGSCSASHVQVPLFQPDNYTNEARANEGHVNTPTFMDDDIFSHAALDQFCNLPKESQVTILTKESCFNFSRDELFCIDEIIGKTDSGEEKEVNMESGESLETGITIRTYPNRSRPPASSSNPQGTANRRIRLKKHKYPIQKNVSSYKRTNPYGYIMKVLMIVVLFVAMMVGMWKARQV